MTLRITEVFPQAANLCRPMEPSSLASVESAAEWEAVMSMVDPWEKAAECERAIETATNRGLRTALTYLRELWIALGKQRNFLSADDMAREIEAVGRLQVELTAMDELAFHLNK